MSCFRNCFQVYVTSRRVSIRSKRIGIVNSISKLIILFLIGGLICFQYFIFGQLRRVAVLSSTLTTKVKGLGYIDSNNSFSIKDDDNEIVFDTADYVIPSDEKDSIFIMTNFIKTQQNRDICDEDPTMPGAICQTNADCLNKDFTRWNGKPTGLCINSTRNSTLKVCQIKAWCPVEDDTTPNNVIQNVFNYTIFVKSTVEFRDFEIKEHNILSYMTNDYLSTCTRDNDTLCPIFQVGDIVKEAEPNSQNVLKMLTKGGVIEFEIIWNCDYSPHVRGPCLPQYKFERFDGDPQPGFNFRYADKFVINNTLYRDLYKVFGLRIMMTTTGQGLKPDAIGIIVAFLAFTTLFSFSIVITDCYILNCFDSAQNRTKINRSVIKIVDENSEKILNGNENEDNTNGNYHRI